MAVLSTNRIRWGYVSDDGNTYRVSALKALTDQGVVGGATVAANAPLKPLGMRMRRIYVTNGTITRSIPSYDTVNAAWTGGGGSVNIDVNNVETAFDISSDRLEERRARRAGIKQDT